MRDGALRSCCQVGQVLEGTPLLMKEWPKQGEEPAWKIRAEFAVLSAIAALIALLALWALLAPSQSFAHPGGLAADGCHNDRKNGGRHCHRGPNAGRTTQPPRSGEVYYPNCDAARRAGAAPVRRGDPGYGRHLDRDNDGIGCE